MFCRRFTNNRESGSYFFFAGFAAFFAGAAFTGAASFPPRFSEDVSLRTRSRISLPALNLTVARGGIGTLFSGSFGLRPTRALVSCAFRTPKLRNSTVSPRAKESVISANTPCTTSATNACGAPAFSLTRRTISRFVRVDMPLPIADLLATRKHLLSSTLHTNTSVQIVRLCESRTSQFRRGFRFFV